MCESAGQSGIHHQELFHLVLIACSYHNKLSAIVLHTLHQGVDGLLAVHVASIAQRVCLVNEQYSAHSLVTHAVDNLRSLSHILSYESSTTGLYHARSWQDIHCLEYLTHLTGYRCLTCTWVTSKDEVHCHLLNISSAHSCALLHEHALYSEPTDRILDAAHTNELFELVENNVEWTSSLALRHWQIVLGEGEHVAFLESWLAHLLDKTLALTLNSLVEDTACLTSISEVLVTTQIELLEQAMDSGLCILVDSKVLACSKLQEDLCQLVWSIVVEVDSLSEATLQAWVRIDEVVHVVSISSNDTDELTTIVLQTLQQSIDSLSSEGIAIARLKRICLVDKQHTTQSLVNQLVSLNSSLTRESSHQLRAVGLNKLAS